MDDRTNFFVGRGTLSLINAGPVSGLGQEGSQIGHGSRPVAVSCRDRLGIR
jgi:hypothetical protein